MRDKVDKDVLQKLDDEVLNPLKALQSSMLSLFAIESWKTREYRPIHITATRHDTTCCRLLATWRQVRDFLVTRSWLPHHEVGVMWIGFMQS